MSSSEQQVEKPECYGTLSCSNEVYETCPFRLTCDICGHCKECSGSCSECTNPYCEFSASYNVELLD